jgi:hypothetical protein
MVLRFLSPVSRYEKMVSMVVGSPIHVDMIFHQPRTSGMRFSYSAFMGEKFSLSMVQDSVACSNLYHNVVIDLSDDEHTRCISYVNKLLDKTSYNYNDAMILMPILQHHPNFTHVMLDDVDGKDPGSIPKIYCSQAVVLVLRECLSSGNPLEDILQRINSRIVSPSALLELVSSWTPVFEAGTTGI